MSDMENLHAIIRPHCANAWERGMLAGMEYGRRLEQFDPAWHRPDDEPARPPNPYKDQR